MDLPELTEEDKRKARASMWNLYSDEAKMIRRFHVLDSFPSKGKDKEGLTWAEADRMGAGLIDPLAAPETVRRPVGKKVTNHWWGMTIDDAPKHQEGMLFPAGPPIGMPEKQRKELEKISKSIDDLQAKAHVEEDPVEKSRLDSLAMSQSAEYNYLLRDYEREYKGPWYMAPATFIDDAWTGVTDVIRGGFGLLSLGLGLPKKVFEEAVDVGQSLGTYYGMKKAPGKRMNDIVRDIIDSKEIIPMSAEEVAEAYYYKAKELGRVMLDGTTRKYEDGIWNAIFKYPMETALDLSVVFGFIGTAIKTGAKAGQAAQFAKLGEGTVGRMGATVTGFQKLIGSVTKSDDVLKNLGTWEKVEEIGEQVRKLPLEVVSKTAHAVRTIPWIDKWATHAHVTPEGFQWGKFEGMMKRELSAHTRKLVLEESKFLSKMGLSDLEKQAFAVEVSGLRSKYREIIGLRKAMVDMGYHKSASFMFLNNMKNVSNPQLRSILKAMGRKQRGAYLRSMQALRRGDWMPYRQQIRLLENMPKDRRNVMNNLIRIHRETTNGIEDSLGEIINMGDARRMVRAQFRWLADEAYKKTPGAKRGKIVDDIAKSWDTSIHGGLNKPTHYPVQVRRGKEAADMTDLVINAGRTTTDNSRLLARKVKKLDTLLRNPDKYNIDPEVMLYRNAISAGHLASTEKLMNLIKGSGFTRKLKKGDELLPNERAVFLEPWRRASAEIMKYNKKIADKLSRTAEEVTPAKLFEEMAGTLKDEILGGEFTKKFKQSLHLGEEVYAVPREFATGIARMLHTTTPNMLLSVLDGSNHFWRNLTLYYNPLWYAQNAVSNVLLSAMAGASMPEMGRNMWDVMRGKYKNLIPAGVSGGITQTFHQAAKRLRKLEGDTLAGTIWSWADEASAPSFLKKIATKIEDTTRSGPFLTFLTKGMKKEGMQIAERFRRTGTTMQASDDAFRAINDVDMPQMLKLYQKGDKTAIRLVDDAIDKLNDAAFDFDSMLHWEKSIVKRGYPFWSWARHTNMFLGRMVRAGFREPLKGVAWHRLSLMGLSMNPEEDRPAWAENLFMAPDWVNHMVFSGGAEDGAFLAFDARRYHPFLGVGLKGLSPEATTPIFKVSVEQIFGQKVWTRTPFRNNEIGSTYSGYGVRWDDDNKKLTAENWAPPLHTHILNQFYPFVVLNKMLHPYLQNDDGSALSPSPVQNLDGTPKFELDRLEVLSNFGGLPLKFFDEKRIKEMKIRKRKKTRHTINQFQKELRKIPRGDKKKRDQIRMLIRDLARDQRPLYFPGEK